MNANLKNKFENTKRCGKRREVSLDECFHDLKVYLPKIFIAFKKAVKKYNKVASMYSHQSKVRFDATVLNTSIVESLQEQFPKNWRWGKYKRFILRLDDYIFLVKKLNNQNKPMNIETKHVNTISNQLSLPLFSSEIYQDDPILFFGYKRDRTGEVYSPQIVYIDEDKVKWIITEDDLSVTKPIYKSNSKTEVKVSLKESLLRKKASNDD